MEQQTVFRSCCCRTRRTESKSINLPSSSQPLDSSPRSRRTEEVARWRWSPRLWRLRRWELSHQRLLMGASPRMGDTTRMRHCRSRPRHHPCKGEREVRPSRRNWSSWFLGRVQPGVQKSHPHALLVLLLRRPPCARDASLRVCLPVCLHGETWLPSSMLQACYMLVHVSHLIGNLVQLLVPSIEIAVHSFLLSIESFFKKSTYIRQRGSPDPNPSCCGTGPLPSVTASLSFRGVLGKPPALRKLVTLVC